MPYKKYEPKVDELNRLTRVRLGGIIGDIVSCQDDGLYVVCWRVHDLHKAKTTIALDIFPDLEIFVQPLTIPRATIQAIQNALNDVKRVGGYVTREDVQTFEQFFNSLEVTND